MKRLSLVIIALLVLACGSNAGTLAATPAPANTEAAAAVAATKKPATQIYKIGDVIEVNNQTVVLNSAAITANILKANFTITNNGTTDLALSQYVNFSAKDSEGVKLEVKLFDCGSSIDGTVIAGDKIKGDICWTATKSSPIRIYYEASLLSEGAIVWEISS